jgi:hypothetical protein
MTGELSLSHYQQELHRSKAVCLEQRILGRIRHIYYFVQYIFIFFSVQYHGSSGPLFVHTPPILYQC